MRAKEWRQGIITGVLLLVALWLGVSIWGLLQKAEVAVSAAHDAKTQYEELESRKNALQQNLDTLATPLGKDAAIRQAFGVARPGEEVIVVVPPATATPTTTPSWWQDVLNWF